MQKVTKSNVFLESVLGEVPRLLGQQNRNPSSPSYGSFDRAYWHYRTNDISCARYQEAALTLALLYKNDFEGNIYYQDTKILEWINAALSFTLSIQNTNGSFDEWYLNEGSFVCTSFVVTALSNILLTLRKESVENYDAVLTMLVKGATWIQNHEEKLVLNQSAGSVVALYNVFLLTKNPAFKETAEKKSIVFN